MSTALNFKCDQVKLETERELNLSTDLLAEAGIKEPKSIFGKVPTRLLLTGYLIIYTITSLITMLAVGGKRLGGLYLLKAVFMVFGVMTLQRKRNVSSFNLLFTVLFGVGVVVESVPCIAGILALFTHDICSVLAGLAGGASFDEGEDFLKFCQGNLDAIRLVGSMMISSEVLVDAFMFTQLVRYQKYLKSIQYERNTLNRYTGKERISLP